MEHSDFFKKLGTSWEDMFIVSVTPVNCNQQVELQWERANLGTQMTAKARKSQNSIRLLRLFPYPLEVVFFTHDDAQENE